MSTIVYQDLQFIESNTNNLTLKFNNNPPKCEKISFKSSRNCSWSEIESLSTIKHDKNQEIYVHPLHKNSSFKLSEKSLEMCTESLGNETGCSSMDNSFFLFPLSSSSDQKMSQNSSLFSSSITTIDQKASQKKKKKEELPLLTKENFPPPLTTRNGENLIKIRSHREQGRLVIEAINSPPKRSYMQSERIIGRLKLSLTKDYYLNYCSEIDVINKDEENRGEKCQNTKNEATEKESVEKSVEKEASEGRDYLLLENDKNKNSNCMTDSISVEFGVKLGLGNLQRLRRCKEGSHGNKRLINWEPFWVVT
ncbi:protein FANTASTIC FOUR 3-like [Amaranthus tricolor]|uniref:protein FANTASTIC FOUR 3-like n=1 Tax=Amaranthus tricolor TaxID=29722 RepID=UPI0025830DD0|nr:protein FANTASTIC FOUR 3-like [Amaranthus tricolor]